MATIGEALMQSSKSDTIKQLKELINSQKYNEAYKYILEIDERRFTYGQFNPKRNLHSISHKHLLLRELKDNLDKNYEELVIQVDKSIEEYTLKDISIGTNYMYAVQSGVAKTISDNSSRIILWFLLGFIGLALLIVTIFEPNARLPQTFLFGFGLSAAAVFFIKKNRDKQNVLKNDTQVWLGESAWIYNLQVNVLKNICFMPAISSLNDAFVKEFENRIQTKKLKKHKVEFIDKNWSGIRVLVLHWIGDLISPLARYTVIVDASRIRYFSAEKTSGESLSIREFNDKGGWVMTSITGVSENDLDTLLKSLSDYLNVSKEKKVVAGTNNSKEKTKENDNRLIVNFNSKVKNVLSNLKSNIDEIEVVTFSLLIEDIKFCNTTEKAQDLPKREKIFRDGFESMSSKSIKDAIRIRDAYSVILGDPSEYVLGQSFNLMPVADVEIIRKLQSSPYGIVMLHFIDRLNYGFTVPEDTRNLVIGSVVSEMAKFEDLLIIRGELWQLILDYIEQ